MQSANAYLPEFLEDFNRRFAVVPRSNHDAHRPLLPTENLDLILSRKDTRTLTKNLTIQYNTVIYQIQTHRPTYALRNAKVTVCENAQGQVTILYNDQPLDYTLYQKPVRQAEVVSTKSIDAHLKKKKKPHTPAPDHPWRQYGKHINGKPIQEVTSHASD
jgi:hypothetical protein